ncbi:RICIN domain-containing protein [Streptomyces sp. OE57]|uniref:RICIN domain-containing protein n=1 Tax=Streptomyces lacaronensis TaxID=3379885 RepID=UPI0039B7794D
MTTPHLSGDADPQSVRPPSVIIPTGRDVWIDHLQSSLHLNSEGFHGGPNGHAFLFHDRDTTNTLGEKWRFESAGDGTYYITNAESRRQLITAASGLDYKKVVLTGDQNAAQTQKWRVRASGLFDSFSMHPDDDPSQAIAPLNNADLHLYLLPFQQYLTQFFKVVERNV